MPKISCDISLETHDQIKKLSIASGETMSWHIRKSLEVYTIMAYNDREFCDLVEKKKLRLKLEREQRRKKNK